MKALLKCEFEAEVLAAVLRAGWPDRADAQLRAHAASCAICSDVAAIAGAIEESRMELTALAAVPDAGRVWWLAQRRARLEAAQAAARPMTAVLVAASACALGLFAAYFRVASGWMAAALGRIVSTGDGFRISERIASATSLLVQHGAVALAVAAVLFLVPAAAYFAMGRD